MNRKVKPKKVVRFRICLFWGALIAIIILLSTSCYRDIGNFKIDNVDRTWELLHSRMFDGAYRWLIVQWRWTTADSDVVNITVDIIHVILITILIPLCAALVFCTFAFGYAVPLCLGSAAGYLVALMAGRGDTYYFKFMFHSSRIAIYITHTLMFSGLLYSICSRFNIRMDSLEFITRPLKTAIVAIYDIMTDGKGVNTLNRNNSIGSGVAIPQIFDEQQIETGLLRYRSDKGLLRTYVSGLIERYKDETQIKVIKKKMERLDLGREYLEALYQTRQAYNKVMTFDEVEDLERRKRQLEQKKLEAESTRLELAEEVKRKTLELKLAQLDAQTAEVLQKANIEKKDDRDDVRMAIQRIRDSVISIERIKLEIKQSHPKEEADRKIDEFDRMLVEKGIVGE